MPLYIVEALRLGNREKHSYVVGVWDNFAAAKTAADDHAAYRGVKYVCKVNWCTLYSCMDSDQSATVLYETKENVK
jgi:hypothetical protein